MPRACPRWIRYTSDDHANSAPFQQSDAVESYAACWEQRWRQPGRSTAYHSPAPDAMRDTLRCYVCSQNSSSRQAEVLCREVVVWVRWCGDGSAHAYGAMPLVCEYEEYSFHATCCSPYAQRVANGMRSGRGARASRFSAVAPYEITRVCRNAARDARISRGGAALQRYHGSPELSPPAEWR